MIRFDHRALYIYCDGSMMPGAISSGGTGYVIKFPEEFEIADHSDFFGTYEDANIERLEIQGLIHGMQGLLDWLKINVLDFSRISKIIVITDRFDLQDEKRTNAYKIRDWRSNGGKNFEGKEIKNWDLLNKLDKTRTKLSQSVRKSVRIEYRQRKLNKEADKLSKKGRIEGIPDRKIAIEGHKIGTRLFDGREINYSLFFKGEKLIIHIFRKRPIKVQWEINAEIVSIKYKGWKLIIITDHLLQEKLNRGNLFEVKIKNVYTHHIEIFRTITKLKKSDYLENKI